MCLSAGLFKVLSNLTSEFWQRRYAYDYYLIKWQDFHDVDVNDHHDDEDDKDDNDNNMGINDDDDHYDDNDTTNTTTTTKQRKIETLPCPPELVSL